MKRTVLDEARTLMRRRKFHYAITLLESHSANYKGSFEFYLALGTSCLYVGDEGNAVKYYDLAREIKIQNTELLLGQAVIFLRRGATERAIEYYMEVLNISPCNETARAAMEFIRTVKDYTDICKLKDTGEIKNYYPPLGFNPDIVRNCVLLGLLAGIAISISIVTCSVTSSKKTPATDDFDPIALTSDEQKNAVQDDLGGSYVDDYILDDKQINKSYEDAIKLFKAKRENAALVEINRLTYSNASSSIKVKASNLKEQLFKDPKTHADRDPEFSTLRDNYSWEDVVDKNTGGLKNLFRDCYVVWVGKIANIETSPDGSWKCTLLVYNKEFNKFFGYLTVNFDSAQPSVNEENPIAILGRLRPEGGKFCMDGRVVFQSIINSDLYELLSKLNL